MSLFVDHATGSIELLEPLRRAGLPAEKTVQSFGDFAWVAPHSSPICVGVELKNVKDLVDSLRSNRINEQIKGMCQVYDYRWLVVEGDWTSQQGHVAVYRPALGTWQALGMTVAELDARLLTIEVEAGFRVRRTASREQTVQLLAAMYRWWTDKPIEAHVSLTTPYIPSLLVNTTQFRRTAMTLPGLGQKGSILAERHFETLRAAFTAPARQWSEIDGIGLKTATRIVRAIDGRDNRSDHD